MKKLFILFILVVFSIANADDYTLDVPAPEVVPTVIKYDWDDIRINLNRKRLTLYYSKVNADGKSIPDINGKTRRQWNCQDIADDPETSEDETNTCWTNIFMYSIRTQDAGTSIGRGFRLLIRNQMMADGTLGAGTFND